MDVGVDKAGQQELPRCVIIRSGISGVSCGGFPDGDNHAVQDIDAAGRQGPGKHIENDSVPYGDITGDLMICGRQQTAAVLALFSFHTFAPL